MVGNGLGQNTHGSSGNKKIIDGSTPKEEL
jgi:hypothetical protein